MSVKRLVNTDFWLDSKVDEFSPEDKYFMLYLLTSPFTKQLGIFSASVKQMAFHLGYSVESVKVLLDRFSDKYGMILYSEDTGEIAILNYLRHSVIRGGKPVEDCIRKDMAKVKNKSLITSVFLHIKDSEDLNETVRSIVTGYLESEPFEKSENYNISSIHNDKDDDDDNDNIVPRIVNDSCDDSIKKKSNEKKKRYGEYGNVLLTDKQYIDLQEDFPLDYDEWIGKLDRYLEQHPKKAYKNHLLTIRTWAKKEGKYIFPEQRKKTENDYSEAEAFFDGLGV